MAIGLAMAAGRARSRMAVIEMIAMTGLGGGKGGGLGRLLDFILAGFVETVVEIL